MCLNSFLQIFAHHVQNFEKRIPSLNSIFQYLSNGVSYIKQNFQNTAGATWRIEKNVQGKLVNISFHRPPRISKKVTIGIDLSIIGTKTIAFSKKNHADLKD